MEQEVSTASNILVTMIVLTITISVVAGLILVGRAMMDSSTNSTAEFINYSGSSSELLSLITHRDDLPVPAVLVTLKKHESDVISIGGTIGGKTITKADDLTSYMSKTIVVSGSETPNGFIINVDGD